MLLLKFSLTAFFPGVLPCAPPPGAAHDQCNAASGLHPQCDHRAKETGCGPGRGGHQMGVTENQRPAGKFMDGHKCHFTRKSHLSWRLKHFISHIPYLLVTHNPVGADQKPWQDVHMFDCANCNYVNRWIPLHPYLPLSSPIHPSLRCDSLSPMLK